MLWLFFRWLPSFGMLLFVFKDCESLFLRHEKTDECVTVSDDLVYDDPDYAKPYFTVMTDNCLDAKAQFRYRTNTELLQNIETQGILASFSRADYHNRWTVYKGVSQEGRGFQNRRENRLKQTHAGSLLFYNRNDLVCAEPSSTNLTSNNMSCDKPNQKFTFGTVTRYNTAMTNTHCSKEQSMKVGSADYGSFDKSGTFNKNAAIDRGCSKFSNCRVKSHCDGERSCELTVNNDLLSSTYCPDTSKQIYTKYTCADTYSPSAITAARRLRLTSRNRGFIEIYDGSIWRRVNEKNWDVNRQRMLCKYLGFEEITQNTFVRLNWDKNIATGDLICYETQPSGTSCCIHLEPSASTRNTRITNVKCKICDNPILEKVHVVTFSGKGDSGNDYEKARITSDGWCPSGSSSAFLLIDLKREYHIKQVVVMADKEQTNWAPSYSLSYSHDNTSYKNAKQISGNHNGFKASTTDLDIYNVRYVKIQTSGTNFCLRIELCGKVLMPAKAWNIKVSPSVYSATVSWEIPTSANQSSYITHVIIYLGSNKPKTIARATKTTLTDLEPGTGYYVGIVTQDGYSVKSRISWSKYFTTKQADPCDRTPCKNGASCTNVNKSDFTCTCADGYYGKKCSYLDPCYSSPCQNGASCARVGYNNFKCTCTAGYFGQTCLYLDPCYNTPCKNGASCARVNNYRFKCTCTARYQGGTCSERNPCYNRPCKNGASCARVNDNEFRCTCTARFYGERCSHAVPRGAPWNVTIASRGKHSLLVSWNAPRDQSWDGEQKKYRVCYSYYERWRNFPCRGLTSSNPFILDRLNSAKKYFVTVSTAINDGGRQLTGPESEKVSQITSGEPVELVAKSYSSLSVDITRQSRYIREVMVIVQIATKSPTEVEKIPTNDLEAYKTNTKAPYIAAYFKTKILPLTFEIGNGSEHYFNSQKYINQPLKQNTSYIVFLRFFENKGLFYSTEWSKVVKTLVQPPVPPVISKIVSTAPEVYTITWDQPTLPIHKIVLEYNTKYRALNGSTHTRNVSKDTTSISIDVKYEQLYTFQIRVVTPTGTSDMVTETWFSHAAPLELLNKTNDGCTVELRKPRKEQKIKNVSLVLFKSESENPRAPEEVELQKSPPLQDGEDVAFRAIEFDTTDFQEDTIEISLQLSANKQREKRNAIVVHALTPTSTYRTAQLNIDENGNEHWSYWSEPFTFIGESVQGEKNEDDTSGGGSIVVVVSATVAAVLIVVALVLVVIFLRRRRRNKRHEGSETGSDGKTKGENDVHEMDTFENENNQEDFAVEAQESIVQEADKDPYSNERDNVEGKVYSPIPIAEFSHYVNEMKAKENSEFQKQYDDLPANSTTSWEVSRKPFNKEKNRYGNIVTYDYCRVVLSGKEKEDYINASYMDGIKENSYIATQGPKKHTVKDMWRMVWEQNSFSIVMVTSLVEVGKPKCEKYWPDSGTEKYGDIEVTLVNTEEFAYHVTHSLKLKKDDEEREVRHYYYHSWPDHGVPKYPTQLLTFRRQFRTHHEEKSGPIIVHCSAGVGRTGVFLAIDMILDKLEKGVINSIDVFGEVCAMRERRMNMVQTLEQYIFIHEAILETILCGMNEVDSINLQKEVRRLTEMKTSTMSGFEERFETLGEVSPKLTPEECTAALLEGNAKKNRDKNVYPAERNRVCLEYVDGVENSDYINAVYVNGYLGRNYFIATQSPLPSTVNDFWRLVHSQNSSTIVLLSNVKEGTSYPRFWPTNRAKPTQYGSLTVQLESQKESDGIWTKKFILAPYPDLSDGRVVNIFHYTKWPKHQVPVNVDGVIELTSLVEDSRKNHGNGPIIVACSDGAGRTGTYIAISNLLERVKVEQAIDVFQCIKIIRAARPQFVENAEQYQFCYTAVLAYLDGFSDYANFE